jgi:predicted O-methyltransferase YrrM
VTLVKHTFPTSALNVAGANAGTVELFASTDCLIYGEVGVYEGDTAMSVAEHLAGRGEIHLFDFDDRVNAAAERLREAGHENVVAHPNSRLLLDSYNWSLMEMLAAGDGPVFDYVFIDGAHTWGLDALAFLLVDRLLRVGGYVDFDDYTWSLRNSPSMSPDAFPEVEQLYTAAQIDERQVALVVDLLVRRDPRYAEVVPNKVFRKDSL